jgi:hypothetical protein
VCFRCDDEERLRAYVESGVLTTKVMLRATIESVQQQHGGSTTYKVWREALAKAHASTEAVQRAAKDFERAIWFGGLQKQVRAAKHRGLRAGFEIAGEKYDVLAWSCAGRVVFTIQPDDELRHISVICAEDGSESTMGIQGICATEQQAIAMLAGACTAWNRGMTFERDDKVGML